MKLDVGISFKSLSYLITFAIITINGAEADPLTHSNTLVSILSIKLKGMRVDVKCVCVF